jgi:hypothetical protein
LIAEPALIPHTKGTVQGRRVASAPPFPCGLVVSFGFILKRQSERFKETAREVGADQPSDAFDRIIGEMGRRNVEPPKPGK